jgi:hypothetical protein
MASSPACWSAFNLIKPSEWLPIIWGRDDGEPQAAFDNLDHVNRVLGLIMEDYNGVARPRSPPDHGPPFSLGRPCSLPSEG